MRARSFLAAVHPEIIIAPNPHRVVVKLGYPDRVDSIEEPPA